MQWNTDTDETDRSDFFLQYQPAAHKIVNLRYSFQNNDFEQVDASTLWPVSKRWTLAASTSYSLQDQRNLESYAGFQYRSCLTTVLSDLDYKRLIQAELIKRRLSCRLFLVEW